ncbi:MAG: methylated-DNA--[protein]-cysteine S-methyltransferase [Nitrospinaceae bacterium]|nr:methylated-DNA--[protein]-cysteine S-methyltransferase [Nitrospinaceae bacterium]NIR56678.1 methylated-DNA--[protein]-cysteine S-methyltransferase [Nitrospinaceae bacterium]NIS87141.1 methylated-DNA--[protein]-cysteine S-methyltransferase [Nitrospinaceae bacterium]NIT83995.1 methylated-DNA--[protein]-cysteine S-methyltransferase [Nitrospinaceae bacterium]NIU46185.1 methylated-DNA--[protein]-cysteine S-methyltransferase [Nitrospinaceae bacterium]
MTIPKKTYNTDKLYYAVMDSPLGLIGLAVSGKGLVHIQTAVKSEKAYAAFLKKAFTRIPEKNPSQLKPVMNQLRAYFKGGLQQFDLPLDFLPGTDFQKRVWKKLQSIPYGETRSYAWLARAVKHPQAARAVGNANGKNPIPIVVPCHRIIQSNGDLGGYTSGPHIKQYLLELEENGHATL